MNIDLSTERINNKPISRVYNMDCMEFLKQCPDKFFSLACVDPPYFKGVGKFGFYGEKVSNTGIKRGGYSDIKYWDDNIPDREYFEQLERVSSNQIIWGCNYYAEHVKTVGRIVWDKVNDTSSFSKAELASCSYHDSVQMFRFMWNGMLQGNMKNKESRMHPTQKPVALYDWTFKNYAKPGDKILDTHLGSQSSRIAAYKLGFDFFGTELDEDYFNQANERFAQSIAMPLFDAPKQTIQQLSLV